MLKVLEFIFLIWEKIKTLLQITQAAYMIYLRSPGFLTLLIP